MRDSDPPAAHWALRVPAGSGEACGRQRRSAQTQTSQRGGHGHAAKNIQSKRPESSESSTLNRQGGRERRATHGGNNGEKTSNENNNTSVCSIGVCPITKGVWEFSRCGGTEANLRA